MANKTTKKEYFAMVADVVAKAEKVENRTELLEFINREVALLDKKASSSKATNVQQGHDAIITEIMAVLADAENPMTVSEMMEDSRLATYEEKTKDGTVTKKMTNQKLSSLVRKLKEEGMVVRTENKKKAYFSIAPSMKDSTEGEEIKNE